MHQHSAGSVGSWTASGLSESDGVAIDALAPGTTVVVTTRNSQYRLLILVEPSMVMVQGGAMFPEATIVRLDGAAAGGSPLKPGWILVGFQMRLWRGPLEIRSSKVRSVSVENPTARFASPSV
jgi:hypothetical protein